MINQACFKGINPSTCTSVVRMGAAVSDQARYTIYSTESSQPFQELWSKGLSYAISYLLPQARALKVRAALTQ